MSEAREKMAPVQGYPGGIPWAIHLEAYEVCSKKWAPQPALIDLEGRNCRGGFSTSELDEFVPGWRDRDGGSVRFPPRAPALPYQSVNPAPPERGRPTVERRSP